MLSKRAALALAWFCACLLGAATAQGRDSFSIDVSGHVPGNCKMASTGPYNLSFTLDPAGGADALASTTAISFWCTKGVVFTIRDDGGLRGDYRMAGPDAETIPYSLSFAPSSPVGGGHNQPIVLTVSGRVGFADFSDKQAGIYTDRVTVSIDP